MVEGGDSNPDLPYFPNATRCSIALGEEGRFSVRLIKLPVHDFSAIPSRVEHGFCRIAINAHHIEIFIKPIAEVPRTLKSPAIGIDSPVINVFVIE